MFLGMETMEWRPGNGISGCSNGGSIAQCRSVALCSSGSLVCSTTTRRQANYVMGCFNVGQWESNSSPSQTTWFLHGKISCWHRLFINWEMTCYFKWINCYNVTCQIEKCPYSLYISIPKLWPCAIKFLLPNFLNVQISEKKKITSIFVVIIKWQWWFLAKIEAIHHTSPPKSWAEFLPPHP